MQNCSYTVKLVLVNRKLTFYVQLPLGKPWDFVWLPMKYFVCPNKPPGLVQSKNVMHCEACIINRFISFSQENVPRLFHLFFFVPWRRQIRCCYLFACLQMRIISQKPPEIKLITTKHNVFFRNKLHPWTGSPLGWHLKHPIMNTTSELSSSCASNLLLYLFWNSKLK